MEKLQTSQTNVVAVSCRHLAGDGNCMYRAAADQLFDDDDRHMEVRAAVARRT